MTVFRPKCLFAGELTSTNIIWVNLDFKFCPKPYDAPLFCA